jgi:flagellin
MSLRINTNIASMDAHRNLQHTAGELAKSMQRLSSGLRVNSAADDPAGLAISEKLTGQINGLDQAQRNAQDGISLVQTAEGTLNTVQQMLQQVRQLAVQYQNGTYQPTDLAALQSEVNQFSSEIERIGTSTTFNGIFLLNSSTASVTFQIGANDGDTISVSTISLGSSVGTSFSLGAAGVISTIDAAISAVSAQRASLGAVQNRLSYTINNLALYQENLSSANSQIMDVDMASETANYTKTQVLQSSGTAILAQANQSPNSVMQLLQNL